MTDTIEATKPRLAFVTGGRGFLGATTARLLAARNWQVATIGLGTAAKAPNRDFPHFEGVIDRTLLSRACEHMGRPDVVLHAAGGASVGLSWQDPRRDFERSVLSTVEILDFLRHEGEGARLVLVSSAAVFGSVNGSPRLETDPCRPVSPYGAHKHVCEELARCESRMRGLGIGIVRFFSLYGEGLHKQLLWDILGRLSRSPEADLELWGDGGETRDFLHVDDAAMLLTLLAEQIEPGEARLYNGGSGTALSVRNLAAGLIAKCGATARLTFNGKSRAGDPRHLVANVDRARSELNFVPRVSLDEGLRRYVEWFNSIRHSS